MLHISVCVRAGARVWVRADSLTYPACNAPPYSHLRPLCLHQIFRYYHINGTICEKENLLNIKRVFLFCLQILFEIFMNLRRIQQDIVINVKTSSCKVPVILVGFLQNLNFLTDFRKKLKYQDASKSVQWESSCSMRSDGRTDGR